MIYTLEITNGKTTDFHSFNTARELFNLLPKNKKVSIVIGTREEIKGNLK